MKLEGMGEERIEISEERNHKGLSEFLTNQGRKLEEFNDVCDKSMTKCNDTYTQ